jgi:hypothetical protein
VPPAPNCVSLRLIRDTFSVNLSQKNNRDTF